MSYLLDTNVISELRKGDRCDESVAEWWSGVAPDEVFLSVLTIGEIRKGIENIRRRDAWFATTLERWLLRLRQDYADRILPVDVDIMEEWGRLNAPDLLPVMDSLLAATAKVRGLIFVTRNIPDIARTGVASLNPWRFADR